MSGLVSWINFAGKALRIAEAGYNIGRLAQKDKWSKADKVDFAAQLLFAGAQATEIGFGASSNISSELKIASSISAGALDMGRVATRSMAERGKIDRETALDMLQTGLFRVGDLGFTTLQYSPQTFGSYSNSASNASMIATTASVTIQGGRIVYRRIQDYRANVGTQQNAAVAPQAPPPSNPGTHHPHLQRWLKLQNARLKEKALKALTDGIIINGQIVRIDDLSIGNSQGNSEVDKIYKDVMNDLKVVTVCKMTGKPIVDCLMPAFDTNDATQIYDRASVDDWLRDKPNTAPPDWPVNEKPLPLQRSYFFKSAATQRHIDTQWEAVAKEFLKRLHQKQKEEAAQ